MVSEGVDIPRLRVGVYATTTTTELFFRQAVGRFVRWTRGVPRQRAWLFIPDDPRLRSHAARIAEQRRHSLRRRDDGRAGARRGTRDRAPDEQMSLFAAISAVATDATGFDDLGHDELDDGDDDGLDDFELTLAPPPPLSGGGEHAATPASDPPRGEAPPPRRRTPPSRASSRGATGLTHAQVNAELNRLSGVGKVSEATVEQLERRLAVADKLAREDLSRKPARAAS